MTASQTPPVTISDIAAKAGVSVPTVSRVLNGRSDVAPHTRQRVEELLREYGYQRRGARTRERAWLIDLVFDDLDSPWAVEIMRGAEGAAHDVGAATVVSAVHGQERSARQWLENLRTRASDGVVLVTSELEPKIQPELRRLHVRSVVVDPAGLPDFNVPTIGATNWAGGLSATEHLVSLGHRRIAHVAGRPGVAASRARLDGYRAGLDAVGLRVDPGLVVQGNFDYESGFRAGDRLLRLPDRPTAVFAGSDQMALGVYEAARRLGLRVPEDVSVVGFDDLPQASWSSPPLTTVRQPLAEMGMLAVRTVLRLANGERIESPRVELATELVVRDSTAAPGGVVGAG